VGTFDFVTKPTTKKNIPTHTIKNVPLISDGLMIAITTPLLKSRSHVNAPEPYYAKKKRNSL
jgi:hypothetical protein